MSKVLSLVADAVRTANEDYGVRYFVDERENILSAEDVISQWEPEGSIEVDDESMIDEGNEEYRYLQDEGINRVYQGTISMDRTGDEWYDVFRDEMSELAAWMAIESDPYALGNEWVEKALGSEFNRFVGMNMRDVQDEAREHLSDFFGCGMSATIGYNDRIIAAEFLQNVRGGHRMAIRCVYGDWFVDFDGTHHYSINDSDDESILEEIAEIYAEQVSSRD